MASIATRRSIVHGVPFLTLESIVQGTIDCELALTAVGWELFSFVPVLRLKSHISGFSAGNKTHAETLRLKFFSE